MLELLKAEANLTQTENGAVTYKSTLSHNLDLFATVGALRHTSDEEIIARFIPAYAENADLAMKLLFFARDIRGGLGERRVFRVILKWLGNYQPSSAEKNIRYIAEFGRFDDLLCLLGTKCEDAFIAYIKTVLESDLKALEAGEAVTLLGKWLPSINASNQETVANAKRLAKKLGYTAEGWRKTLTSLRAKIKIIENNLRKRDYTFDYEAQPSRALFKYRQAFMTNDGERYSEFLRKSSLGLAKLNTAALTPYDVVASCIGNSSPTEEERAALDTTWRGLEGLSSDEDAIAVIDGSGSMFCFGKPLPAAVAMSLGIYFAEHNRGRFARHFITFSERPQLVELKGKDIYEKVRYCMQYDECANTDLEKVFRLILDTAVKNALPQCQLPKKLYVISDMEFDACAVNSSLTNFENAKQLYEAAGYELPLLVFWNVNSMNRQQPVTENEQGAILVSGATPRVFGMLKSGVFDPSAFMNEVLLSERYEMISA